MPRAGAVLDHVRRPNPTPAHEPPTLRIRTRPRRRVGPGRAARHQDPARLQRLGRARDDGRLRAALHAALVSQVVGVAGRQHRLRSGVLPGARSRGRNPAGAVRLHERVLGHPRDGAHHLSRRPADQCVCRTPWRRHGPADAWRGLRLHRLDHHFADLRLVHLHLLRARGGRDGLCAGAGLRHPAIVGVPDLRAGGDSAGHARCHGDQPAAGAHPAAVAGDAGAALRHMCSSATPA